MNVTPLDGVNEVTPLDFNLVTPVNNNLRDEDKVNNNNPNQLSPEQQAGFNSFINNLLFLINNNDSSLQSNFDFLINLLLPNSSTLTQTPSLSAF